MVSEKFRCQLRQEAAGWRADGLIDALQYEQLEQRYQFQALDTDSRNRFVMILLGLGGILLGLAVITFVAANWQIWSRGIKLGLLLSLLVGVNTGGFYLWRGSETVGQSDGWRQRLGHGLLLLGALILGANLALTGQLFHQSGSAYGLCLAWGFGVLGMAYALSLVSLGFVALSLMGIGYWLGVWELSQAGISPFWSAVLQIMPLLAAGLFLPLAYRCRSRVLFGLTALAIVSSLTVVVIDLSVILGAYSGFMMAIAVTLPPALLWAYDDRLWAWLRSRQPRSDVPLRFQPLAQNLALGLLAGILYVLSFHSLWPFNFSPIPSLQSQWQTWLTAEWPLLLRLSFWSLIGFTLLAWIYLGWPTRSHPRRVWRLDAISAIILLFLGVTAFLSVWHWQVSPIQALATFLLNLMLFLLALGLMREGLGHGHRRVFWNGMLLVVLQIVSRMLEYDTSLVLKALVFALCGVGLILVGLWFERYVRTLDHGIQPLLPTGEVEL